MKSNHWFVLLTTVCLTIGQAFAAPDFDPEDPPEPGTYSLTVNVLDAMMGSATGSGMYADGTNVVIEATPNSGYVFVKWSDEVTTNPRTVKVTMDKTYTAVFGLDCPAAGSCGASLNWSLSCEGVLTITGSGAMTDYADEESVPWYAKRNSITSVMLPIDMTHIGAYAFAYCQKLTVIPIPDKVKSIGAYAFSGTNLMEVILPEGFTTLAEGTFMECQSLRTLTLPAELTSIGALSIAYCGALERVNCNAMTPPTLSSTAFEGDCYKTVHVPCLALTNYEGVSGWKDLDAVLPQTTVTIVYSITSNDDAKGTVAVTGVTEYCDRTELTAKATPKPGYEFIRWSDAEVINPRALVLTANLDLVAIFQVEVDPGNLRVCISGNSVIVENSPYAADIVIRNADSSRTTSVPRTASPQTIGIPEEWPAGDYIFEFDSGNKAFIVTKQ